MTRRPVFLALLLFAFTVSAFAQDKPSRLPVTAKEIEASFETEWFGLYLQGKKIGYVSATRAKAGEGDNAVYRESLVISMKLTSFGQKAEFRARQHIDFDMKPPFAVRAAQLEEYDGKSKQIYRLTRTANGYELAYPGGKEQRKRRVASLDYTLADAMASELWIKRGAKTGDRLTHRSFEIKDLEVTLSKNRIVAEKTSLVGGVKVEYLEVETELPKDMITTLFRHDRKGHTLSGQIAIFDIRRETAEQAKNTEYSQDVFVLGQVKIQKPIGNPVKVNSLVLEVKGAEKDTLRSGPRQTVSAGADGVLTIRIGKAHGRRAAATAKEIEDNLRETPSYLITSAEVKALAEKAVGNAESPEDKVKRLVSFVHDFIRPSLSVSRPNIPDLLVDKRGDCKSYALLFATLARAAGIPAREVSGLMYMGDDQKSFGGHAWNEVVVNGEWVPIDATFNEVEVDATHISFGSDSAATATMLKTLGKLSFRLVEAESSR